MQYYTPVINKKNNNESYSILMCTPLLILPDHINKNLFHNISEKHDCLIPVKPH